MYKQLTKEQYNNAVQSGFTHDEIVALEKKRKESSEETPGYFIRVAAGYKKAAENVMSGIQEGATTIESGQKRGGVLGALEQVGGALRGGLRTVGGVVESTFNPIVEAPGIKQGLEAIGTGISKIPGIDVIVKKAMELSKKYPSAAKDLQNIIDIATLTGGKVAEKPLGKAIEKAGVSIEKSGIKAAELSKNTFAQELVMPIETKAVKLAQVKRTTEAGGLFKKDIVAPTVLETASAKEVAQISGISPKNTYQKNFNIVRDFNIQQAKQLESDISTYDFIIPKQEIISKLNKAAETLQENPLIVGDAEKMAGRLIEGAKKIIEKNEGKGSGLLKARKEYDAWVLSQKPKAFDATAENAFTVANNTVRDTLNTILDDNATNLGIKDSLRKQFNLYKAMENIAPKAAEEANTPITRAMQRIGQTLGTKNKIVQAIAAAVGIGGLGAAATFAPAAAVLGGVGYVIYSGGKLILNPQVRILFGRLLQTSSHMLNPEDKRIIQNTFTIVETSIFKLNKMKAEILPIFTNSIRDPLIQITKQLFLPDFQV